VSQIEGVDTLCVFGVQCVGVLFHISDTLPVFCSARPVLMSFVLHMYHLNMIASRPSPEFGFLCDFFDDIIVLFVHALNLLLLCYLFYMFF